MSESGKQALLDLGTLQTMGTVTCLPPPQDPSAGAQERKGWGTEYWTLTSWKGPRPLSLGLEGRGQV